MTDRLKAGERLGLGDKLVSPNGLFTLWMQPDNNLVLYRGTPEAGTAYWATGTLWLPQGQRPTTAEMQADAHFVLYDPDRVPRWVSGTWGPGFVEPYIVLRDDGNLVIYHRGDRPVWASGGVGGVGRIPGAGFVTQPDGTEAAVDRCGRLPPVVAGSSDLAPPTSGTVDVEGVAYIVTEQRRRLVNDVVEQAFLQDIAAMGVWPGQTIQGKALLAGDVAPIGPFPRRPGTLGVTDVITDPPDVTDAVTDTPHGQSATVEEPDAASVNEARLRILRGLRPSDSPGPAKTGFERASTLREVGVKLGVTVKGAAFGVDANASLDQTRRRSTVVASIRQVFYSVTFTPHGPRVGGMWDPDTDWDELAAFMGPGNPPLYVDSVQYGRFICVTAQGSFASTEIAGALKAHWKNATSGTVALDARTKEVLENCQVKVYTIGVPGRRNFQDLTDPLADLREVYRGGLAFSLDNPGAPVSFTCRHIADGTLAHVGLAAEYTEPLSARGEDLYDRPFEVFDGPDPGHGLVDTGIRVNPGDRVTVRARGRVWSGVIFSQPHGPEGWRGHGADPAAPLPQGTAYAFIIRFGDGKWIEAGPFWEGSPDSAGLLQLNVNDNIPWNGDSSKRWQVHVDVRRAGAEAVGIFV